jgi:hypothetical protein
MKRAELIDGVVIFIIGGVTAALSLRMPIGTFRMAGSGLFPLCLGIALMLLALLRLANLLLGGPPAGVSTATEKRTFVAIENSPLSVARPESPRPRLPGPPAGWSVSSGPRRSPSSASTFWDTLSLPFF